MSELGKLDNKFQELICGILPRPRPRSAILDLVDAELWRGELRHEWSASLEDRAKIKNQGQNIK